MSNKELNFGQNMMIIKSSFGPRRSFKMIPVNETCPYIECLFDPESRILAIISKNLKQSYHMLPKLDENGDPVKSKMPRPGGKVTREERRLIETYSEYYILDVEEVEKFIKAFAFNAEHFNYKEFLEEPKAEIIGAEKPSLITKI